MMFLLAGCATRVDPSRPISKDLPLSYIDLVEIKEAYGRHQNVLKGEKIYYQPELTVYLTSIGTKLVKASERPDLPYRFFVLDDDRVDLFSVGGGYVYVTKGMLQFIESEPELAAALSHEIAHVAAGAYTPEVERKKTKKEIFFQGVKAGVAAAAGAAGSMVGGPAGNIAEKAVDKASDVVPSVRKQFKKHEEIEADGRAVVYMVKVNYDPRELKRFLDKISKVEISEILRFIEYLSTHPPYEERREELEKSFAEMDLASKTFETGGDHFVTVRAASPPVEIIPMSAANTAVQPEVHS